MTAKSSRHTPTFRLHKATGQGYVVLDGRHFYLGRYDSPESRTRYHQIIAEWIANGRTLSPPRSGLTVAELILAYWKFVETYYVGSDQEPSGEVHSMKSALRPLRDLYGPTAVEAFGPKALKAVRQCMIDRGWCRRSVNRQVGRVKRCFRWGVENELVEPSILHGLEAVQGLRAGRTAAKETEPVKPILEAHVTAVLPFVSRQVGAMIGLQLLTAARPGEIVRLRPLDFDTSGAVWLAKLEDHKTAYRGKERVLYFGPKAQQIVHEFLADTPLYGYLFRPVDAEDERLAARHAERKTPLHYGNAPGTSTVDDPQWQPGERYTTHSYRRAIERGCQKAKISVWSPHRLRHNAATIVRREYGLEAAQLILGHARADVTQLYAEVNHLKALEVAQKMG